MQFTFQRRFNPHLYTVALIAGATLVASSPVAGAQDGETLASSLGFYEAALEVCPGVEVANPKLRAAQQKYKTRYPKDYKEGGGTMSWGATVPGPTSTSVASAILQELVLLQSLYLIPGCRNVTGPWGVNTSGPLNTREADGPHP